MTERLKGDSPGFYIWTALLLLGVISRFLSRVSSNDVEMLCERRVTTCALSCLPNIAQAMNWTSPGHTVAQTVVFLERVVLARYRGDMLIS